MGIYINIGNAGFQRARNSEYVDKSGLIAVVNSTLFSECQFSCVPVVAVSENRWRPTAGCRLSRDKKKEDQDMTHDRNHTIVRAFWAVLMAALMLLTSATVMAQDDPQQEEQGNQQQQTTGVLIHGNVYGGGNQADVKTNTEVNMSTGTVEGNVYGGGNLGDVGTHADQNPASVGNYDWKDQDGSVITSNTAENKLTGVCKVTITGGTVGVDVNSTANHASGHVFGAGKGLDDTWWCEKAMAFASNVSISAGTVYGNVYGGGQLGRVEDDAKVVIGSAGTPASGTEGEEGYVAAVPASGPDIKGDVFGAGAGIETHGYSALVRGNAVVTVQGIAQVGGSVYGGGEIASVGRFVVVGGLPTKPQSGGTCIVNIKDNATIGTSGTSHNVFGACKGVAPHYDENNYKSVYSMQLLTNAPEDNTLWDHYDGNENSPFILRYYKTEQDYLDFLNTLALTSNPHVTIGGTWTPNETTGTISASGTPSIFGSVYGGGQRGVTLGAVDVNMVGGTVEQDVYGGGALADTNLGNWDVNNYEAATAQNEGESITDLYTRTGAGTATDPYKYTKVTNETATFSSGTYYRRVPTWAHDEGSAYYKTTVDLTGGLIKGDAYGGGLGQKIGFKDDQGNTATKDIEAVVWGDIAVTLGSNGGASATAFNISHYDGTHADVVKSGRLFGCNNLLGSPQGDVRVTVFNTVAGNVTRTNIVRDANNKIVSQGAVYTKVDDITVGTTDVSNYYTRSGEEGSYTYTKASGTAATGTDYYEMTEVHTYEVAAVYGGGNLANYTATGRTAYVRIETCDVSIEDVYGGGNAAEVPGTDVLVRGAHEIAEVFGGGNGKDQFTTDGGTTWENNPGANVGNATTPGNATTLLTGGYVHEAYGGSNKKGTIYGNVSIDMGEGSSANNTNGACTLELEKLVGAGKDADVNGDLIMVMGCKPDTKAPVLYAGADNANVNGDVELTITSGKFGKVFGGNNQGGIIMGHIKLNIEETGNCVVPIEIDELYLGGNEAMYSQYGYYKDGDTYKPRTAEMAAVSDDPNSSTYNTESSNYHPAITTAEYGTEIRRSAPYAAPVLNVISCTYIGKVFGGGYGSGAALYGNPTVNINMIPGSHASDIHTKMDALTELNLPSEDNANNLGIIGDVYGGGNEADVIGNPTVNIGTESTVYLVSTDATETVRGAYITGNVYGGGKGKVDNFFCDKAMIGKDGAGIIDADGDGELDKEGGTTVNIFNGFVRGNVYGGGQIGRVEKNTVVTIGTGDGVAPGGTATSVPIIMGSVYGGGAGEEEHGYAALVRGNPTVTIQGNAKVRHSVYGGGEIASVARYNVPRTEDDVQAAIAEGYTEAKLGMPYALKDPNSGTCTVTVRGYAEIGPEAAMQMTKEGGPDDTGYVFGAGKGILPGGEYEFEHGTTRRMVLYDDKVHTTVGQTGSKWQWVDPDHTDTNKNVWEYFDDLDEYIRFIQTLALSSRTYVTITGNAFVKGSVYGGSENGIVQFDTDVKIQGGQIGWGAGETGAHPDTYWTTNSEDPTKFAECAHWLFQEPYAPYDPYATTLYDGKYYYDSGHTQEAAGGAMVATDGHTYYGNVFGGGSGSIPYFDTTKNQSVYLHSAGQVKGNTNVTISGGHILTNVYGGCEATNVDGTATVTMTAGTVGVPRTDEQIIAHPLTGYIFGGGKGDQRIFFNKDTNVKDAVVKVEGGRVYGSVYGGGEDGHVLRNVTLTIGKQTTTGEGDEAVTTTSGPKIGTKGTSYYDGHVFGGGRGFGGDALTAGNVGGSVDVNILDGEILGSVYGGGRLASVGYGLYLVDDEVNGVKPYGIMRPDDEYDGSYTNPSTEEAEDFFTKGRGHINISISGGTIGNNDEYAYDADNQLTHTKGGNVFAGGMGRMYTLGSTETNETPISSLDWWKLGNVKSTKLTISGNAKIKSCVYGGGELGMVQGGNHTSANSKTVSTEIIINGGTIGTEVKDGSNVVQYTFGSVFGGGYGSLTEKLDHTGSTNPTYSTYKYTYPKYIAGRVKGSTEVTMTGGVVLASVYGGGEMAAVGESKVLSESTDPKVLGETLTGNNGVPIEANTYVTISDGTIGKKPITLSDNSTRYFGGAKMGNVYGGGSGDNNTVRSGHVYGNTYVTISDGTIYHNVYGGGAYGTVGDFDYNVTNEEVTVNNQTVTVKKVSGIKELKTSGTGVATVTITNGTIGYDGKENGMVFGSSRGDINRPEERDDYTAWVYDANVTIGTAGTPASGTEGQEGYVPATDASGPDIKGSIYGSGENGHTFNNTIVTVNGGKIGIDDSSDPGYTVSSNDKDYSGAEYTFRGNVYGGGCGTDKYYSNHALENHSGNGQLFNALAGVVYGNAEVNINGGTVVRNVYGAGAMGSVGRKVSTTENNVTTTTITGGTTTINITGGTIGVDGTVGDGNVFGAARGDADATSNEFALVRKETSVSVTGGTVNGNVYGGGELGCVGVYEISSDYRTFTWQDTDGVTNTVDNDKNTGICKVTVDGSSAVINGNVFGAGKGKDDTFWCEKGIAYSTNVSIKNGTVNGKVYGGGEVGRVETDTEVKVGDGEGTAGGASAPTIAGSVFGGGAGVETHGYSALVRGNTKVTVEGNASVGHSVFGGGEIASVGRYALDSNKMPSILQGGGYCYVTIRGHATITDDVFGAGEGVTPHFDNDNADETKRSRRMTLKNGWESLVGGNRFDWDYLQDKSDYLTYLETLALATHPEVTIGGSAAVGGSVFGGGELGLTKGSVIVNIQGGTIAEDVYGGGSLANTNTTSSVDTNGDGVADKTVHPTTSVNLKSGTVNHNVYGGGLGRLEKAAVLYTATDPEVTGGTKNEGDIKTPAVTPVEAKVYGTVLVKLNEPVTTTTGEDESTTTTTTYGDCEVKGTIFGCNNLNGSPQKDVTVHVWKTVQKDNSGAVTDKPTKNTNTYEMTAVYGGGNLAAFYPDDETARASAKANVIIDGCDLTSIGSVYGGGNAASVPATEVIVNGTYEIGEVFGGGNGKGNVSYDDGITYVTNPGANVGYLLYPTELDPPKGSIEARNSYAYGSGKAHALINGGTVHTVYGGSNTKGNVRVESRTTLEDGDCDNNVGKAYGGGNDAPMDGNAILEVGCLAGMSKAFGGAANANVEGDVVLNIINGTYGQVFGGNDQGGVISGTITVNIEETGCRPIIIGQLYGGGNFAPYSVENIDKSRTDIDFADPTAENYYKNYPKVNVKSFTSIGTIFGGGYGEEAVLEGNPTVNINVYKGKYVNDDRTVIDSGAKVVGKIWKKPGDQGYDSEGYPIPEHKKDMIGAINDVFGGGNEAEVIGTPHVNIGTKMGEVIKLASMAIEDSEGKAPSEVGWIPSYELVTVEGVDIRGNVYGGGNAADVTGDAEVVIGKKNSIKTYKFTSYSADSGGTVWSSGLAQTTGVTKGNLEEVEILTNGKYGEFVGRKYYVSPNAATDGSARTELKDANGASLNPRLYVAIKPFENKKIYNFESYSAETGGTQYSTGTASATGNFKDFNGTDYMQIVVLTNGEISWEGKTFYVPANAQPGSTRYQLHKADGSTVDVWVSITE